MDSRKKSKGQRLFSNGVVVLVCLILAAQTVFFGKYLIDSRRAMRKEQRQEELQASQDNIQDNTPGQEGLSITGQGGSSSRRTGGTSYEGQPGRTPSVTAAARAGSTSDNHPSERTFSPGPASTPASAAGSSPHTDSIRGSDSARNTDSSRNSRKPRHPPPAAPRTPTASGAATAPGTPTAPGTAGTATVPPAHIPTTAGAGTSSSSTPPTVPL